MHADGLCAFRHQALIWGHIPVSIKKVSRLLGEAAHKNKRAQIELEKGNRRKRKGYMMAGWLVKKIEMNGVLSISSKNYINHFMDVILFVK